MSMVKAIGTMSMLAVSFGVLGMQISSPEPACDTAGAESLDLGSVRTVCVDAIVGDPGVVAPAREMIIAGLFGVKRFKVIEKCDQADAILKGAVVERREKNVRAESDSIGFGTAHGGSSVGPGGGSAGFAAAGGSTGESLYSAESGFSASVVLRLVNREGVVVWAHTQESPGGKVKAAIPDAADRAVRQMIRAIERSSK